MPTASYSFTRADAATLGAEWTLLKGLPNHIGIKTNAADITAADDINGNYYSATAFAPNQFSKATVGVVASDVHSVMVLCSTTGSTKNHYGGGHVAAQNGNLKYRIWKEVAGDYTSLAETASQTMQAGDVVELQYNPDTTTLTLIVNSTQILSVSDGSLAAGQPGLFLMHSAIDIGHFTGTWTGGDLGAGDIPADDGSPSIAIVQRRARLVMVW